MNVGEVAALAGVTVRTLHHYDRNGLLSPSGRTTAGYRQYSTDDVDRLHQVLLNRALGFSLEEVAALLDDPSTDPAEHLRRQHRLLLDRLDRTSAMVAAVEKEMEARSMGISLTPEERFEVFGDWLPEEYAADSPQAMALAEEHRQQISRNFYDCTYEIHAGLGRLYVEDERFTAYYERNAPGLAQYVSTAVQANGARQA